MDRELITVDKQLRCNTCYQWFDFSANEAAWFKERGLTHEPKHCAACRALRKRTFGAPS
jgi:hypothetical protein